DTEVMRGSRIAKGVGLLALAACGRSWLFDPTALDGGAGGASASGSDATTTESSASGPVGDVGSSSDVGPGAGPGSGPGSGPSTAVVSVAASSVASTGS